MDTTVQRSAGVLLHITSLPSPFGMGDMGPGARAFADFLFRSQQTFWQLLPLNPAGESEGFSPYSSSSTMAGNIYLISPEDLANQGWLTKTELTAAELPFLEKADLKKAADSKTALLWKAYQRYLSDDSVEQRAVFNAFYEEQEYWLRNYSHYALLKQIHQQAAWWQWPEEHKTRRQQSLDALEIRYGRELHQIRWQQLIFHQQWKALKEYCGSFNIQIIGDLPFYVACDSADVWSNRTMFAVKADGQMTAVAGVPPDAFNDDGQLWGMPVYNWTELKKTRFKWWITRLKKNKELFDLIRLDHFRALASYWSVPPKEKNARKGKWKNAPGKFLLKEVLKQLGGLPFIAEDLGEISEDVFTLRDAFGLPGMNVLQFAFGEDMPYNAYIPHHNKPNAVIYTGTHDNNTTKGWYATLRPLERSHLDRYLGTHTTEKNISLLLCRLAYGSVSSTAILALQDILELGENARMNTPAGGEQNWAWRLHKDLLTVEIEERLSEWCSVFDRRRDGDTSFATLSASLSHTQNAASHA